MEKEDLAESVVSSDTASLEYSGSEWTVVLVGQLVEHQSRNLVVVGLSPIQDSSVFPFT